MSSAKLQMVVFSVLSALVSAGGLAYIFIERPTYLHATAQGVPYYTPPVLNPLNGQPLDLDTLVRHFEAQDSK